jgi:hypothetical protein
MTGTGSRLRIYQRCRHGDNRANRPEHRWPTGSRNAVRSQCVGAARELRPIVRGAPAPQLQTSAERGGRGACSSGSPCQRHLSYRTFSDRREDGSGASDRSDAVWPARLQLPRQCVRRARLPRCAGSPVRVVRRSATSAETRSASSGDRSPRRIGALKGEETGAPNLRDDSRALISYELVRRIGEAAHNLPPDRRIGIE